MKFGSSLEQACLWNERASIAYKQAHKQVDVRGLLIYGWLISIFFEEPVQLCL